MKLKGAKGFTLIELVVVIIIIAILALVAVPMYKNYVNRAMASEGVALIGGIITGEKAYYVEFNSFMGSNGSTIPQLGVDASSNKYFSSVNVTGGASFNATAVGANEANLMSCIITGVSATAAVGHITVTSNGTTMQ